MIDDIEKNEDMEKMDIESLQKLEKNLEKTKKQIEEFLDEILEVE